MDTVFHDGRSHISEFLTKPDGKQHISPTSTSQSGLSSLEGKSREETTLSQASSALMHHGYWQDHRWPCVHELAWWPLFQHLKPCLNNHTVSDSGDENAMRLWESCYSLKCKCTMTRPERWFSDRVRLLPPPQRVLGFLPSTHKEAHNIEACESNSKGSKALLWTLQAPGIEGVQRHTCRYTYTCTIKIKGKNMVAITEIMLLYQS